MYASRSKGTKECFIYMVKYIGGQTSSKCKLKMLWQVKVPNKTKSCLLGAWYNALPTKIMLYNKQVISSISCKFAHEDPEMIIMLYNK